MKQAKNIVIRSSFGHEIFAVWTAKLFNVNVLIVPNTENEEEYATKAKEIFNQMSFFTPYLVIIPFDERENALATGWDIVTDLRSNNLDEHLWEELASVSLQPSNSTCLPSYNQLLNKDNILVVMQKWLSDNGCGVTAQQQSLPVDVFKFLHEVSQNLVFGQHFNKVNDLDGVKRVSEEYNMYIPGFTENQEVLGIRGVLHAKYYNMYNALSGSVGIAGTHTWYLLAMFPDTPQIILYNRSGVENWEAIAEAMRKGGRKVEAIGFDENTNFGSLSEEIKDKYLKIFG